MQVRVNPQFSKCLALTGLGIALVASAALVHFVLAPQWLRLPAAHAEARLEATSRMRDRADGDWAERRLTARRVDQALVLSDDHVVIQGDVHWSTDDGDLVFERVGIYGVDRHTRANLPAYGDTERHGQYGFPPHVRRQTYRYWDPQFIGAREAHYVSDERRADLTVMRFDFEARDLDETNGFRRLPDVPHRFDAHTEGNGSFWVEPTSGLVVDYAEHGRSYFVEPVTGKAVADFYRWDARFTSETRAQRQLLARNALHRILLLETAMPALTLAVGLALVASAAGIHLRHRAAAAGSVS